jgi:hypothetical protein
MRKNDAKDAQQSARFGVRQPSGALELPRHTTESARGLTRSKMLSVLCLRSLQRDAWTGQNIFLMLPREHSPPVVWLKLR